MAPIISPRGRATAVALLTAAAQAGLAPNVVKAREGGYDVPDEVADIYAQNDVVAQDSIDDPANTDEQKPVPPVTAGIEDPAKAESETADDVKQPAGNGSRDDWAAFATSKGAPAEETAEDGLSRDELKAKYGTQSA